MKIIKTVLNTLSIIFLIILFFWVTQINYSDLSFKENSSPYLGISTMLMISFAMQMIKRGIKEK
jgi:hypothetical protein